MTLMSTTTTTTPKRIITLLTHPPVVLNLEIERLCNATKAVAISISVLIYIVRSVRLCRGRQYAIFHAIGFSIIIRDLRVDFVRIAGFAIFGSFGVAETFGVFGGFAGVGAVRV